MIWNIEDLSVYLNYNNLTDVVYKVNYLVSKTDNNGYSETIFKTSNIDLSNLDSFIDFEDLTEEIVLEWIKADLGESGITALEDELNDALELLSNTSIKTLQ